MKFKKTRLLILIAILTSCNTTFNSTNNNFSNKPEIKISSSPTSNSSSSIIPEKDFVLSSDEIKEIKDSFLVKSNNTFGINFFKNFVEKKEKDNIFISTLGISLAFQMLINGAEGNTRDELSKVLELGVTPTNELNRMNKLMITRLNQPSPETRINVANSLWFDSNRVKLENDFKDILIKYYDSDTSELDFSKRELAIEKINKWVSDKTNTKITQLLSKEDNIEALAYLVNVLYFKSSWEKEFLKNSNFDRDFNLQDGKKKIVTYMSDMRNFKFLNNEYVYENGKYIPQSNKFTAVELPYGKDKKVSMYLFLPNKDSSLDEFYKDLSNDNLEKWFKNFSYNHGYLTIPKFKMESNINLVSSLKKLGLNDIFSDSDSNLNKVGRHLNGGVETKYPIYVSDAFQKTFVDINEEGTEAAASTIVQMSAVGSSTPLFSFVADRPFFFVIRDNETGLNLFMGAVNDPKYE